jgi:hypothetical protein
MYTSVPAGLRLTHLSQLDSGSRTVLQVHTRCLQVGETGKQKQSGRCLPASTGLFRVYPGGKLPRRQAAQSLDTPSMPHRNGLTQPRKFHIRVYRACASFARLSIR